MKLISIPWIIIRSHCNSFWDESRLDREPIYVRARTASWHGVLASKARLQNSPSLNRSDAPCHNDNNSNNDAGCADLIEGGCALFGSSRMYVVVVVYILCCTSLPRIFTKLS